jgi:hypothetical protein
VFDQGAFKQLEKAIDETNVNPTRGQNRRIREVLSDDLQHGRVKPEEAKQWLARARESQRSVNRHFLRRRAAAVATTTKKIPGEPDVLDALLSADTPARVRELW